MIKTVTTILSAAFVAVLGFAQVGTANADTVLRASHQWPGGKGDIRDEMVQIIARELKVEIRRARSPIWPFLAVAAVMEKVLTPLGIQPPLHRRRLDFFRKSFYFNNEKAAKLIDFIPGTDFATGVAKTANWYSEHMDF